MRVRALVAAARSFAAALVAALAGGIALAPTAGAQAANAWQYPVGTIGINQQVQSTLAGVALTMRGTPAHFWWFSCTGGQTIQLDVVARWDAYALITDPAGKVVAQDDDSGGDRNARVTYTCPVPGTYRLGVTTRNASGEVGEYRLSVRGTAAAGVAVTPMGVPEPIAGLGPELPGGGAPGSPFNPRNSRPRGLLRQAVSSTGELGDGSYRYNGRPLDAWQYGCEPHREVTVNATSAWDNVLVAFDAAGREVARDDNSGAGRNARLVFQCEERVLVTFGVTAAGDSAGTYSVAAQARSYIPPLAAIPVPRAAAVAGGWCPNAGVPICTDAVSGLRWSRAENGVIPASPFPVGTWPRNGVMQSMSACRGYFQLPGAQPGAWQVLPGKISQGLPGCYVGVNSAEVLVASYEVLVHPTPAPVSDPLNAAKLVVARGGMLPPRAIVAGNGESAQFVCVAAMAGDGAHPGRIAADGRGCVVAWAGKEVVVTAEYQVLARP